MEKIPSALILPELAATSKKETLLELATAVQAQHPVLSAMALRDILLERESLGSTAIGEGIAIPHGKVRGLSGIVLCFGRSSRGIAFDAPDGKPTQIFILLAAPEHAASDYLSCLARISLFLKNPLVRSRLLLAANREELAAILAECEGAPNG